MKKSSFTEPTGAQGYAALVATQSKVLEDLSRDYLSGQVSFAETERQIKAFRFIARVTL